MYVSGGFSGEGMGEIEFLFFKGFKNKRNTRMKKGKMTKIKFFWTRSQILANYTPINIFGNPRRITLPIYHLIPADIFLVRHRCAANFEVRFEKNCYPQMVFTMSAITSHLTFLTIHLSSRKRLTSTFYNFDHLFRRVEAKGCLLYVT